jgi:hypothetical protein
VAQRLGEGMPITVQTVADGVVASNSEQYATELAAGVSTLADDADFAKALPDHATASAALYVKLPTLYTALGSGGATDTDFARALRGLGADYVAEGAGSGSWSVRLVRS